MPRARPLPPDERRAVIIAAASPLLLEHGMQFTTRQVAEAAGIAEGTIFRVFATKDELIGALFDDALDPTPLCRRLAAIPASGARDDLHIPDDLDTVVQGIIEVLLDGVHEASAVFAAFHRGGTPMPHRTAAQPRPEPTQTDHDHADQAHTDRAHTDHAHIDHAHTDHRARAEQRAELLLSAVMDALRPFEARLTLPLDQAASLLRSVAIAAGHPFFSDQRITDPHHLAQTLLHGMAQPGPVDG